ncbi:YbaY family lipoprotein [Synechococcus sp. CS-1329]|uniref:YbaY family lipoprotein n=1 Tax=Synechococcus sp. CS-1329 TaxID=2847975 RepID=UPI00223AA837|nr:YbaY family lipoprotein [Synechococcus sp. CS-1329]MCT0218611.1 YbaY family lipoprotein [Synechococcus sp. CS-1329]
MGWSKVVMALALVPLGWWPWASAQAGVIEGTASYRERIALPAGASLKVELQDVSRADAAAEVLARTVVSPAGQVPLPFALTYDDAAIRPGRRYTVRATIHHQGRLLFTTDQMVPVLTGAGSTGPLQLQLVAVPAPRLSSLPAGFSLPASYRGDLPGAGGPIRWQLDLLSGSRYQLRLTDLNQAEPNRFDDIGLWRLERGSGRLVLRGGREAPVFLQVVDGGRALRKLDLKGEPIRSNHNDRITRLSQPEPIEPRLFLNGLFTYLADSASISLCLTGQRLPVAMEADYKALEAQYLRTRRQPGEPMLVGVEGLITTRPSLEPGQPAQASLVVERFVAAWPKKSCELPPPQSPQG